VSAAKPVTITVGARTGDVSGLYLRPRGAERLLVFGHGAGAGMRHRTMEALSAALARSGVATLRYQFPYMEAGQKRPSPQPVLLATVRAAIAAAGKLARGLPLLCGGKSMGGRMSSLAAAQEPLDGVVGLVFFGFPLHAPGKPSDHRAEHLADVSVPMLFLQGTRDNLAELDLLRPVCRRLGSRARLHVIEGGDHSFHMLKRSGRAAADVIEELAETVASWSAELGG
jgi:hypothetical protein